MDFRQPYFKSEKALLLRLRQGFACWKGVGMLLVLVLLGLAGLVQAQPLPPDAVWTRIYGGPEIDRPRDIISTDDDGFLVVGQSYLAGVSGAWVLRLNALGDTIWTRNWASFSDGCCSVVQTRDGHYALFSYSGDLIKFNDDGDTLWTHELPSDYGTGIGICQTTDGHYALLTQWPSYWAFPTAVLVTLLTEGGIVLWERGVMPRDAVPVRIRPTRDGGCLVSSYYWGHSLPGFDVRVDRLSANGDSLWKWIYRHTGTDFCGDAIETTNGDIVVTGGLAYGEYEDNVFLARLTAMGERLWIRQYDYYGSNGGKMVKQTQDGGFVIGGHAQLINGCNGGLYLIRTDSLGQVLWSNIYGTERVEQGWAMCRTADGGFAMCGWHLPNGRDWDGIVVRVAPDPLQTENLRSPASVLSTQLLQNFPNPFNSSTSIRFALQQPMNVRLTMYDVTGRTVAVLADEVMAAGSHDVVFDGGGLPSGVYFARLNAGGFAATRKLLLLR